MPFPEDNEAIRKEYLHIKKLMFKGEGESACLEVVRNTKVILASSNLRDVASYCKMHSIEHLVTMDFLCEAKRKGILTEAECDTFIANVKTAGSKLPVHKMADYSYPS
jgi:hypothetical protein